MEEGVARGQDRQGLEHRDFLGLDYPSLYMCKPKRGMKREDSKETYKLPHRLIEKKRRDRINECIAQLKDLLPEHLKLTTLGHLEKAVILELTLKHLKALTALTEQQHQKIIALQNGDRPLKSPLQSDLDAFHSGFQTCTKEVLQYLSKRESWTPREQRYTQLISHLHAVCTRFLPSPQLPTSRVCGRQGPMCPTSLASPGRQEQAGPKLEGQPHCVPVIQRTRNSSSSSSAPHHSSGELGENDTDTDSGYGGEGEGRPEGEKSQSHMVVKQEPSGGEASPTAKRLKLDHHSSNSSPASGMPSPEQAVAALLRLDPALLSSLASFGTLGAGGGRGGGGAFGQQPAAPFCLPFYFISPLAAAAYMQPFLDKSNLEKYLCLASAVSIPLIHPGTPAQAAVAAPAATAAAFPCLSPVLASAEKAGPSSSTLLSPEVASPAQHLPHPFACSLGAFSMDAEPPSQEQPLPPGKEKL
ncbi:PREDICTED: class E basic helix-loop-helix protein 41 [Gekko japonicus]|uniref:Class E basic helix-loop-helix protein 41 n=1 Tax=Gekko japonicus TaxID=146911 RepID=A0ABM1K1B1_GEKJA|nr:PREDICTED: class E basic helix-loop-helix protein 41 [Gekko japonicus]